MSDKGVDTGQMSMGGKLWLLFFTFAKIAALVIGGGLAMLPVIEETFVNRKKLISKDELLDMVTLTQTVPGIIAANCAVYIGMKVAGMAGAVAALLGAVMPSFVVILLIAMFFPGVTPENPYLLGVFAGVRAGVAGLIMVTAYNMIKKSVKSCLEAITVIIFFILAMAGVHPALLIVSGMILGIICTYRTAGKLKDPDGNGGRA